LNGTSSVLILTGPTASGKTDLAIALAERFNAEIIGADSRQIYRGMPIGTAAPASEQLARVPHHLVGFLDPSERYSAARFTSDALAAIEDIHARGKRAIVVGGTGFYVRALCGDVELSSAYDPALRARLAREALTHPSEVLHAWLAVRDPQRARVVSPKDPYRIVRALEIALADSRVETKSPTLPSLRSRGYAVAKVWLEIERTRLNERIERRVDAMLVAGLLDEAERIGEEAVAADAVGYPQALGYLRGFLTSTELRLLLARATRRYAKRQGTWFRAEPGMIAASAAEGAAGLERVARENLGWT
jgi:tRNA dimethylallyltransferase